VALISYICPVIDVSGYKNPLGIRESRYGTLFPIIKLIRKHIQKAPERTFLSSYKQ